MGCTDQKGSGSGVRLEKWRFGLYLIGKVWKCFKWKHAKKTQLYIQGQGRVDKESG